MRYFNYLTTQQEEKIFYQKPTAFDKYSEPSLLAAALGATLYMPATRENIAAELLAGKYPDLVSLVICLEDAIGDEEIGPAEKNLLANLRAINDSYQKNELVLQELPLIFVRVRHQEQMLRLWQQAGFLLRILTGFVFPKFTVANGTGYLETLSRINEELSERLYAMPILETEDIIFEEKRSQTLTGLKKILDAYYPLIMNIRIGATDFSSLFGIRRSYDTTIYEIAVIKNCIASIVNFFTRQTKEYTISGPVWEYFAVGERLLKPQLRLSPFRQTYGPRGAGIRTTLLNQYVDGLIREVLLDKDNGLTGKTIIHPSHLRPVQSLYVVSHEEYLDARSIIQQSGGELGVFKSPYANKMNEIKPHLNWARKILTRARIYGVFNEKQNFTDLLNVTAFFPQHTYPIGDDFRLTIAVEKNPYQLALEQLFLIAFRQNRRRKFLFVSKILGKHLPVAPCLSLLGGAALALRFLEIVYQQVDSRTEAVIDCLKGRQKPSEIYRELQKQPLVLPQKTLFIGFAETATALGHSMFATFADNGYYFHTTREALIELEPVICFEEEHSHATSHRIYSTNLDLFQKVEQIVLVDDEITTGKTALNIIRAINYHFPQKRYVVASLLDWRSPADQQAFRELETKLPCEIIAVSLLRGALNLEEIAPTTAAEPNFKNEAPLVEGSEERLPELKTKPKITYLNLDYPASVPTKQVTSYNSLGEINYSPYLEATGRFGISSAANRQLEAGVPKIAALLLGYRQAGRCLCLGTGEFMYLPMQVAALMGADTWYHSTTRSPIYPVDRENYGARNAFAFTSPDDPNITNYLYNIPYGYYQNLYLFLEREVPQERMQPLLKALQTMGIPNILLIKCLHSNYAKTTTPEVTELNR